MKGTPRRKFKDRPVVIEQPKDGRKRRSGRGERNNERGSGRGNERGSGRKPERGGQEKASGRPGQKDGNGKKKKPFFENVPGFKKKKKKRK